jgi:hypothetical protein
METTDVNEEFLLIIRRPPGSQGEATPAMLSNDFVEMGEGLDMDQKAADQGWQELRANIERFLGQSLQSDGRRLPYEPRFIGTLSTTPADYPRTKETLPDLRTSASAIVGKKGGQSSASL